MVQFLKWLEEQTNAITEKDLTDSAPQEQKGENQIKVIRPLDEEERKLFAVLSKLTNEIKSLKKGHTRLHKSEKCTINDCIEHGKKLSALESKAELIKEIFWRSIQASLKDCPSHLKITGDWQLAEVPDDGFGIEIIDVLLGSSVGFPFPFEDMFDH